MHSFLLFISGLRWLENLSVPIFIFIIQHRALRIKITSSVGIASTMRVANLCLPFPAKRSLTRMPSRVLASGMHQWLQLKH